MSSTDEDEKARLDSIAGLVKQRQFARGYCTRTGNVLMNLCQDREAELPAIQSAKTSFEQKVCKLEEIQGQIELLLTEKEVDAELNEVGAYYEAKIDPIIAASSNAISKLHKAEVAESLPSASWTYDSKANIPKIWCRNLWCFSPFLRNKWTPACSRNFLVL